MEGHKTEDRSIEASAIESPTTRGMELGRLAFERELKRQNGEWERAQAVLAQIESKAEFFVATRVLEELNELCGRVASASPAGLGSLRA
ncbi:MAG: hypothetical protein ACOY0T_41305 [Myxococcota bacterium]